jgi:hypothetical protein
MATIEERLEKIEERLDLIAYILLLSVDKKNITQITDQIATLTDRGMSPAEIGRIVGRKANYVSVMTKRARKGVGKDG